MFVIVLASLGLEAPPIKVAGQYHDSSTIKGTLSLSMSIPKCDCE